MRKGRKSGKRKLRITVTAKENLRKSTPRLSSSRKRPGSRKGSGYQKKYLVPKNLVKTPINREKGRKNIIKDMILSKRSPKSGKKSINRLNRLTSKLNNNKSLRCNNPIQVRKFKNYDSQNDNLTKFRTPFSSKNKGLSPKPGKFDLNSKRKVKSPSKKFNFFLKKNFLKKMTNNHGGNVKGSEYFPQASSKRNSPKQRIKLLNGNNLLTTSYRKNRLKRQKTGLKKINQTDFFKGSKGRNRDISSPRNRSQNQKTRLLNENSRNSKQRTPNMLQYKDVRISKSRKYMYSPHMDFSGDKNQRLNSERGFAKTPNKIVINGKDTSRSRSRKKMISHQSEKVLLRYRKFETPKSNAENTNRTFRNSNGKDPRLMRDFKIKVDRSPDNYQESGKLINLRIQSSKVKRDWNLDSKRGITSSNSKSRVGLSIKDRMRLDLRRDCSNDFFNLDRGKGESKQAPKNYNRLNNLIANNLLKKQEDLSLRSRKTSKNDCLTSKRMSKDSSSPYKISNHELKDLKEISSRSTNRKINKLLQERLLFDQKKSFIKKKLSQMSQVKLREKENANCDEEKVGISTRKPKKDAKESSFKNKLLEKLRRNKAKLSRGGSKANLPSINSIESPKKEKKIMRFGSYLQRIYKNDTREKFRRETNNSQIIEKADDSLLVVDAQKFRGNTSLDQKKIKVVDNFQTQTRQKVFGMKNQDLVKTKEEKSKVIEEEDEETQENTRKAKDFVKEIFKMNSEAKLLSKSVLKKAKYEDLGQFKSTIDCYELLECIGKGSFGKVHLAKQIMTGKNVAVKTINKTSIAHNKRARKKIENEIKVFSLASKSDKVVRLLEVFENENYVFFVMEYAPKGDLLGYMKSFGVMPEFRAKNVFYDVVLGLEAIHSSQIIHRDIKLDNILLTKKFKAKIADFGISKIVDPEEVIFEQCGTPAYLAPEIITNVGYTGSKTDVWSLGVLLHTLLLGKVPFKAETLDELYEGIVTQKLEIPDVPMITEECKDLLTLMLEKKADKRISVQEIKNHSWVEHNRKKELKSVKTKKGEKEFDLLALKILEVLGFEEEFTKKSLQDNVMNHATACYYNLAD